MIAKATPTRQCPPARGRGALGPLRRGIALALAALAASAGAAAASVHRHGAASDEVTLKVMSWGTPDPKSLAAVNNAFMKEHPEIKIDFRVEPFQTYFTALRSQLAARRDVDVFQVYASPFLFDYAQSTLPLKGYVTAQQKRNLTGWPSVSARDGTPYALPLGGQGIVFYYNKALFRKAGLNPNRPPGTYDDLLRACSALKSKGIVPIAAGWKDGYYAEWWGDIFVSQLLTASQRESALTNPQWTSAPYVKGFQYLVQLEQKGCFTPNAKGIAMFPDGINLFKAQKGAMVLGLAASNVHWGEFAPKLGSKLGAFLPPLLPGSRFGKEPLMNFGPSWAWAITRFSEHPKEAFAYISYLVSRASQETLSRMAGAAPNLKGARFSWSNPVGRQIARWVETRKNFIGPLTTIRTNVEVVFDRTVPQFVTGDTSIENALKQVAAEQRRARPVPEH